MLCAFCGGSTDDDPRYIELELATSHTDATQYLGAHYACLNAATTQQFQIYLYD